MEFHVMQVPTPRAALFACDVDSPCDKHSCDGKTDTQLQQAQRYRSVAR